MNLNPVSGSISFLVDKHDTPERKFLVRVSYWIHGLAAT